MQRTNWNDTDSDIRQNRRDEAKQTQDKLKRSAIKKQLLSYWV